VHIQPLGFVERQANRLEYALTKPLGDPARQPEEQMHERLEHELAGIEVGHDLILEEPAEVPAMRIVVTPLLEVERLRNDFFRPPNIAGIAAHEQAMRVPDARVRHVPLR
jgi:hypothetical protein